jgi:TFIIF-interacting CTD phosphatase-like protein
MSFSERKKNYTSSQSSRTKSTTVNSKGNCLYKKEILSSLNKLPLKINKDGIIKTYITKNNNSNNENKDKPVIINPKINLNLTPSYNLSKKTRQIVLNQKRIKSITKNKIENLILNLNDLFVKINDLFLNNKNCTKECEEWIELFYNNSEYILEKTEAKEFFPLIKNSMNVMLVSIILLWGINYEEKSNLFKYDTKKILDNFKLLSEIIFEKSRNKNEIDLKEKSNSITSLFKNIINSVNIIVLKYDEIDPSLTKDFYSLIKNLTRINLSDINDFFNENMLNPKIDKRNKKKFIKNVRIETNANKMVNNPIFQSYRAFSSKNDRNTQKEIRGYSMDYPKPNYKNNIIKKLNENYSHLTVNSSPSFQKSESSNILTLNSNNYINNIDYNNDSHNNSNQKINNISPIYTSNGEFIPYRKINNMRFYSQDHYRKNISYTNYNNYKSNVQYSCHGNIYNTIENNSDKKVNIIINEITSPVNNSNGEQYINSPNINENKLNVINSYNNITSNNSYFNTPIKQNSEEKNFSTRSFFTSYGNLTPSSKAISYRNNSFNRKILLNYNNVSHNNNSNNFSHNNSNSNSNIFISVNNNNNYNKVIGKLRFKRDFNQKHLISNKVSLPIIPFISNKPFTLVINLEETLVYILKNTNTIFLRGGLRNFLKGLMPYYELIVFSNNLKNYADQIIDFIESEEQYFSFRLHRENSTYLNEDYFKDIHKLGRNDKKTIIIDNKNNENKEKSDNEIFIKPFVKNENDEKGIDDDYILHNLIRILIKIAREKPDDIRKSLQKYQNEIDNKVN